MTKNLNKLIEFFIQFLMNFLCGDVDDDVNFVDEFLDFSGFSIKFDEDVLKMMKKRKERKKMKFSMNFWVWSLGEFCFLILVSLTS